jgi:hypothetical protein
VTRQALYTGFIRIDCFARLDEDAIVVFDLPDSFPQVGGSSYSEVVVCFGGFDAGQLIESASHQHQSWSKQGRLDSVKALRTKAISLLIL